MDSKQYYEKLSQFFFGKTKLSKLFHASFYAFITHTYFPQVFSVPFNFLAQETHNYEAVDYNTDAQHIDTSQITVTAPDLDTHVFNGFKGLSEEEAQSLVDAHYTRIETPFKLASKYHYNRPEYTALTAGLTIPDVAAHLNTDVEYNDGEVNTIVETVSSYHFSTRLDNHSRYNTPVANDKNIEFDKVVSVAKHINQDNDNNEADIIDDISYKKIMAKYHQNNKHYNDQKLIRASVLDDRILLIELANFMDGADRAVEKAYRDAYNQYGTKLEAIIFDLRDNPGGDDSITGTLIDDFSTAVYLGYTEQTSTSFPVIGRYIDFNVFGLSHYNSRRYGMTGQLSYLPIKILINNESASAAEVFAGTLQDVERAQIFGKTTSYGKGVAQAVLAPQLYQKGARLNVTWGIIHLPISGSYQAIGIQPDVLVEMTPRDKEYAYIYEKDFPNHIPHPEGKTEADPAPHRCKVDFDYSKGDKQAWFTADYLSGADSTKVHFGYDETMLCAIDSINETPQYSITTKNTQNIPQV
jgi:hypothetical protein